MKITKFQGVIPKVRHDKLGEGFASFAENCTLHTGAIFPIRAPAVVGQSVDINGASFVGEPECIHRIGQAWLAFNTFVPIAEDPIRVAGDSSFLFVRDGALWRSGYKWITDKEGPVKIGIPRPVAPPVVAATGLECRDEVVGDKECYTEALDEIRAGSPESSEGAGDGVPAVECKTDYRQPLVLSFCYTWVTACQEESGPSDYSEPQMFPTTESILLSHTDTPPENAEYIRWYVLLVGEKDAEMAMIAEEPASSLGFVFCPDIFAGGNPLITHTWYPVPCAEGVANIGYGSVAVWAGRNIYISAHKQPHAFPEVNTLTVDDDIVRIVSFITRTGAYSAYVLTKGVPFILSGDVGGKIAVTRVNRRLPCLSMKGVALVGEHVYFCSEEGIAVIGGDNTALVTANWMDKAWWISHAPHTYALGYYDQHIYAFTTEPQSRSFVMPVPAQDSPYDPLDVVYLSPRPSAVYFGDQTRMVVATQNQVMEWAAADYSMQATWVSAIISSPVPWSMGACQVLSDAADIPAKYRDWSELVWEEDGQLLNARTAREFIQRFPAARDALPYIVAPYLGVKLTGNDRPRVNRLVWGNKPFRVSGQGLVRRWQLTIKTTAVVSEIAFGATMRDL